MDPGSRQMFQKWVVQQMCGDFEGPFASKLAPTFEMHSNVGASLLAMAGYQATKITRQG